jgi:hypothetical protein
MPERVAQYLGINDPEVGEDVLFVLEDGPRKGELRPAKVIRSLGGLRARLAVFTDGGLDGTRYSTCPSLVDSEYGARGAGGTWCRP